MTNYAKLAEANDHEGETWRFWIPLDGNEEALKRLKSVFAAADLEEFELDLTPTPESEVDALVKHTGYGYMAYDTKLTGTLRLSDEVIAELRAAEIDRLYKGGIKDLMVVVA